ncbi:MAG TPA: PspC domain-containing protein [Chitinophagaceae bacterium]|nr:PspC domain-containing protein [Chitinophagaceae bacterium]
MKKIININLSGRVIPIEDSAYEKLQAYIESLRKYFTNEEGRDEIINDIESRIAELMSEKIRRGANAITDDDIDEIISSMGRVEDFEAAEKETKEAGPSFSEQKQQQSSYTESTFERKQSKRLYRDSSDKMIGGVCSGIANYLNLDPAIVRILFAIITLGGFGLGVLAYILLWIILPPADLDNFTGKRLYRNPEDKIIGGVAGGLAAYFGKSATTIRLIFAAPLLLNIIFRVLSLPFFHDGNFFPNIVFGSLTGTFILAYIVLWIVLPEAVSQYQKMEMRGEKVDVNSIRQNIREGMGGMKDKVKDWGEEVKESAKSFSSKAKEFADTRGKAFSAEVRETARSTGRGIGHIFAVLFKAFFLFIAGSIAFALFVALIGILVGGISIWPLKNFILDGFWQNTFAWGTLILFFGVPLIGFIVWVLRRIMKVRSQTNYLGWTFGGLWTLGWISAALFTASLVSDFRMSNYRRDATEMAITQPQSGRMIVKVNEPEVEYTGSMPWLDIDGRGVDITKDTFRLANVKIRIELSTDDQYHVSVKKYSRGRTTAQAELNAQQSVFNSSYSDSILYVGSGIAISKDTKYRGQEAIVLIKVPAGKKIRFDESVGKLKEFNIRIGDYNNRNNWDRDWDYDRYYYFNYKTNIDYVMGADGKLTDPSGNKVNTESNNNYRYPATEDNKTTPGNNNDIQKQIDEEKRKQQEIEQKIKDLEKKKNQPQTEIDFKKNSRATDESVVLGPSPVSAMTQWF